MKPETEYIARQLAGIVLRDDAAPSRMHDAGSGMVTVDVEMRAMTRTIRQSILVDHVALAGKVADEIERQVEEFDLDALIVERVREEVQRAKVGIADAVREAVRSAVALAISRATEAATKEIARKAVDRLYAVAFPVPKQPKAKRR